MKRLHLKKLLQNYQPTDLQEQMFKEKTVLFIDQNIDCFERTLKIGHITASAWLQNKDGSKALLLHHISTIKPILEDHL